MGSSQGEGVQVVGVTRERKLRLDEAALRRVLHERLRALPVLVLSVAGAFRGGKSFILDFVLRYLNATEEKQKNGQWLGDENEPLTGFSWRTGVERNTIGIHLWSAPHVITLPGEEKIAVVLMDTQGTFDDESTMRECTSIFALSTLMSSVQIYNISQNLKEDDLQHLELFTGYARIVLGEVGKPFQNLTFLIRDWNIPSAFDFGYQGGKQLLEKKLQVKSNQPTELQDIRKNIHSCFQEINCFLMEYPGFAVREQTFNGKLADLRDEFKANLLEFIPALFAPHKLRPKAINGQQLRAGDLASYLKVYVETFNSDELTTPVAILKATAKAGLMVAVEAARAKYLSTIGGAGEGGAGRALPPAALRALHADAVAAATQLLSSSKTLADRSEVDLALARLTEELESLIVQVELVNNMKIKKAMDEALKTYDQEMLNGGNELDICEDPKKLERTHQSAVETACANFDQRRTLLEGYEDKDKPNLIRNLEERYGQLMSFNELNNTKASSETAEHFTLAVNKELNGGNPCMSRARLQRVLDRLRQEAIDTLATKRRWTSEDSDEYMGNLQQIINNHLGKLDELNQINIQNAQSSIVSLYKDKIRNIFGPNADKCLCTSELIQEEKKIRAECIKYYEKKIGDTVEYTEDTLNIVEITFETNMLSDGPANRNNNAVSKTDAEDIRNLLSELNALALVCKDRNNKMNIAAINGAISVYQRIKDTKSLRFLDPR